MLAWSQNNIFWEDHILSISFLQGFKIQSQKLLITNRDISFSSNPFKISDFQGALQSMPISLKKRCSTSLGQKCWLFFKFQ